MHVPILQVVFSPRALLAAALLLPVLPTFGGTSLTDFATLEWESTQAGKVFAPTGWTLTFHDQFAYDPALSNIVDDATVAGPATQGKWFAPGHASYGVGGFQRPGSVEYPYTFISQVGGGLNLRAHRNSPTSTSWYTAGLATVNKFGNGFFQKYGYFEITAQLPITTGAGGKFQSWPAFWLLTQNGFDPNRTGNRVEIDAIEWYSGDADAHHGSVHLIPKTGSRKTRSDYTGMGVNLSNQVHTFGVKVTPSWVITYMDRKEISRFPSIEEFSLPMYVLVNNAMMTPPGDATTDLGETEWNFAVKDVSVFAMPTEMITDNAATSGVVTTGTWTASTNSVGYYGANYVHDGATGKGTRSIRFNAELPCDGTYEVYTRWISGSNRANNVPYTITTATGAQVVVKDQTTQGGQWVQLGTYYFNEGSNASVTVSNTGTAEGKYVVADAVRFVLLDPWERIVDNTETTRTTATGTWTASTTPTGFYGTNYVHDGAAGKGTKSFRFSPNLPKAGNYEVFARWTAATNRSTSVPIDVISGSGTTGLLANQQIDNNIWVSLGTYGFNAGTGGSVLVSNTGTAAGTSVVADAVKFVKTFEPISFFRDNADTTGVTITGAWTVSTNSGGYYGINYLNDGATGKGTKSVQLNPDLPRTGAYEVFVRYSSGSNRANNVPVDITGTDGTTRVVLNQQLSGGDWKSLGTYNFAAGSSGKVLISNTGTTNGYYVMVDAVKFVQRN